MEEGAKAPPNVKLVKKEGGGGVVASPRGEFEVNAGKGRATAPNVEFAVKEGGVAPLLS